MRSKLNFVLLLSLLAAVFLTGCGAPTTKPQKTEPNKPKQTSNADEPANGEAFGLPEVPKDVVEAITKKRISQPAQTTKPTAAEIAKWSLPKGPKFELIFQHRVASGGPVLAHPDGKSFIHAGDRLARWQIGNVKPQIVFHDSATSKITAISILEEQNGLIAGDDKGTLRIWDMDSGELQATVKHGKRSLGIEAVTVSPDMNTVAVTTDYGPVVFYDSMLQPNEKAKIESTKDHLFFLNEDLLVLMGGETEVWNTKTNEQIARLNSRTLHPPAPLTPNGSFIYKSSDGFKRWNAMAPDVLLEFPTDGYTPDRLSYSKDGKLLLQADASHLEIIDVKSQVRRHIWDVQPMTGHCWIPKSNLLVTTTANGLMRILGTPESASAFGLSPLTTKKVATPVDNAIPPTTAELKAIVDLRELPKLPRFWPTTDYHHGLWYQTPLGIPGVRKFYRHVLSVDGWKEVAAEQEGLFNGNAKFQKDGYSLILHVYQTSRNPSQPQNLHGVKQGSQIAINYEKVTDVSLTLTDFFDMRSLPIFDSTSWELMEHAGQRLRYRTSDSIVACELELLRTLPAAGWVYLNGGSNTPPNTRFLRFTQNGCHVEARIRPDRTKAKALEVAFVCIAGREYLTPPDSKFLSLTDLTMAKSKLSVQDLRAKLDLQMQTSGWSVERMDANNLLRTIYTNELQEVAYRFEEEQGQTVVTKEPHREWLWRNYENSKNQVRAVNLPSPGAVMTPSYGRVADRTKAIEFVSTHSWEQLQTVYFEFLKDRGYKGNPPKKEMDTLQFKHDRNTVRIKFESHESGLSVMIDGNGLKWPNPMPSDKPILRSYSNWLEIKGHDFSFDHLDEFEAEMLELVLSDKQSGTSKK